MLNKELGASWRDNFSVFIESPFAAASIGQVHMGVLKSGEKVAMKIQYPGVKKSVDSDLNNLLLLMKIGKLFPKTLYLERLIESTRQELHEECDYKKEAEKQTKY